MGQFVFSLSVTTVVANFWDVGFWYFVVLINYYFRACDILDVFFFWMIKNWIWWFCGILIIQFYWVLDFLKWVFWYFVVLIIYFSWGEVKYWRKVWIIVVKFRLVLRVFYWWWWRWRRLSLKRESLLFLHGQWSKHRYWCCFLLHCKGFYWCCILILLWCDQCKFGCFLRMCLDFVIMGCACKLEKKS